MATKHSIPPFQFGVDRDYFGAWISGFVDGEGCFSLGWQRLNTYPRPKAIFTICLRADDINILQRIRSYFGCGKPIHVTEKKGSNPIAVYTVNTLADANNIICPHFVKFPLLAKKSGDFAIWMEAVTYMYAISLEKAGNQYSRSKWTSERKEYIDILIATLKDQRKFIHPDGVSQTE
jgi:hypothetical protein